MKTITYEPIGTRVRWVMRQDGKVLGRGVPEDTEQEARADVRRMLPYLVDVKR